MRSYHSDHYRDHYRHHYSNHLLPPHTFRSNLLIKAQARIRSGVITALKATGFIISYMHIYIREEQPSLHASKIVHVCFLRGI
jgi:hypothetical protein